MTSKAIKCPYCSKPAMGPSRTLKGPWFECSSCGATHNPKPTQTGQSGLGSTYDVGGTTHFHPGGVS